MPEVRLSYTSSVTATDTFGPSGLISRHTSSGSVFYAFDYRNSAAERLDGNGNVLSTQTFDAYGACLSTDGNVDPYAGFGGQVGYYTDWETGAAASALELLTFRYYDPAAGRFLNRDPISHSGGANEYEYVNDGPVGMTDPSGLLPFIDTFTIITAAIGACAGAFLGTTSGDTDETCVHDYNVCLRWVECLADALSAALGAWLSALAPVLEPIIGCAEGALSGFLHIAGENICRSQEPCYVPEQSPKCQSVAFAADVAAGCLDGLLGTFAGQFKPDIAMMFEFIAAALGNGFEVNDCLHKL